MSNPSPQELAGLLDRGLRPCLFCGSEVVAVGKLAAPSHPATPYQATCGNCGASGSEEPSGTLAAQRWNLATDSALLAVCRTIHPNIFSRGLDPLPGDGPATRARIAETRLLAERILTALSSLKASSIAMEEQGDA